MLQDWIVLTHCILYIDDSNCDFKHTLWVRTHNIVSIDEFVLDMRSETWSEYNWLLGVQIIVVTFTVGKGMREQRWLNLFIPRWLCDSYVKIVRIIENKVVYNNRFCDFNTS